MLKKLIFFLLLELSLCIWSNLGYLIYTRTMQFSYPQGPFVYHWYLLHNTFWGLPFLLSCTVVIVWGFVYVTKRDTEIRREARRSLRYVWLPVQNKQEQASRSRHRRKPPHSILMVTLVLGLFQVILITPASGTSDMIHAKTTRLDGAIYHIAKFEGGYGPDYPYYLYQCDRFGIVCEIAGYFETSPSQQQIQDVIQ